MTHQICHYCYNEINAPEKITRLPCGCIFHLYCIKEQKAKSQEKTVYCRKCEKPFTRMPKECIDKINKKILTDLLDTLMEEGERDNQENERERIKEIYRIRNILQKMY